MVVCGSSFVLDNGESESESLDDGGKDGCGDEGG